MRTARDKKPDRPNGFSLIELLVVLFIMALITAIIVPKLSNSTDKLAHKEAQRLHYVIKAMKQLSLYQGQILRIEFNDNSYDVASLNSITAQWNSDNANTLNKVFKVHEIDESLRINVSNVAAGTEVRSASNNNITTSNNSAITFYPLAEYPDFHIDFYGNNKHYRVAMHDFGTLSFQHCQPECIITKQ